MTLTAKFDNKEAVEAAVGAVSSGGPVLYSVKPLELEPGTLDRPSRMSLIAVCTAVITGVAMTAFMLWTQTDYPLITGGMPMQSLWPIGVITFETTMLGAIAGTLVGFLIEARFFRGDKGPPEALDSEHLFLRFSCDDTEVEGLDERMRSLGAVSVERVRD